jgi:hypothetical protein
MTTHRSWVLAVAVLVALAAGTPGDAVAKRRSKVKVAATIDGKKLKPTPRTLDISAGGGTIGLGVLAQKIPRGGRGTAKTLYVACATLWPPPALGVPLLACLANYSEVNVRQPANTKYWFQVGPDGSTTVIIDSWDGTNVSGRFTATVPAGPLSPGLPPASIEGTFSGPVRVGDPNR